jgi:hypothetical protein
MKKNYLLKTTASLVVCLLTAFTMLKAQTSTLNYNHWVTNGEVKKVVEDANYLYLGGDFTYIGPATAYGALITSTTTNPNLNYCRPNNIVSTVVPDGSGGWYIGGTFTEISTSATTSVVRNRLAHILSTGLLDMTWDPNVNNQVVSIAVSGSDVYIGGFFTTVGGQTRNRIAKLSATGSVDATWNPNANQGVTTIAVSGTDVYVGGNFATIGGQSRNYIAKLSTTGTGAADATWNPNGNSLINTLVVAGSDVYVGGFFNNIGGQTRNYIAKLSATGTGAADATWNPNPSSGINTIAVSGSDVFVGGGFTTIGGQSRNNIAKLSTTGTGAADATWNPNANQAITTLVVSGSDMYVGGGFTTIGGQALNYIAKLSSTGAGTVDASWNPNATSNVNCIAISSTNLYVGGYFASIGGLKRNRIARINKTTGTGDATWDPNVSSASSLVNDMAISGSDLYVGGTFTTIGGQTRNKIAKLTTTGTGAADATWNPNADNAIITLAVLGTDVFVGGSFFNIGGQSRTKIAKLSTTGTGAADATWNPGSVGGSISTIAVSGSDVYVGGTFTSIGGQTRNRIAKLSTTGTGAADATWDPNANGEVKAITIAGSDIYVGGSFTTIGSQTRNRAAKLSTTGTGTADATWDPNLDNPPFSLAVFNSQVYIGGFFTTIGGQPMNYLGRVSATGTGSVDVSWNPNLSSYVGTLLFSGSNLYVGGFFATVGGIRMPNLALFTITTPCTTPTVSIASQTNILCNGSATGAATIHATGTAPFTYAWSNGGTDSIATALSAGTYTCIVTNTCGADTQTVIITQPSTITATTNSNEPTCNGDANGTATVTVSGGTAPYTYSWSPSGGTAATATGLIAGAYTCTITDSNMCTINKIITVNEFPVLTATVAQANVLCNGANTGAASVVAIGGNISYYDYLWSNASTNDSITGLTAGAYTCTITDDNGCAIVQAVTITQPAAIASAQTLTLCAGQTTTVGANTYSTSGTYTDVLTTTNGCDSTVTTNLTINPAITALTNSNEPTCNGDTNGTAKVTVSGGTAPYTYAWSFGSSTTNIATGLVAGTYTCTITDSNMCTLTKNITFVDFPVLTATVAQANVLCNGANTGAASVVAIGGDAGYYDYSWSNASTNDSIANIAAGAYTCTITDDNGCAIVQAVTITQPAAIASAQTLTLCAGQTTTVGANTYNTSGTYTDVLTTTNGCDSTVTTNLTVENAIDITTTVSSLAITANQMGATYQWIDCATNTPLVGETNATYTATANGNYAAILTVNNCTDTTACVAITSVGIKALNTTKANINVYPNPSNGVFTIALNANGSVIITDVLGKVIINKNVTKGNNTIDLSTYSNGVYVLSVTNNGVVSKAKIIKE